MRTIVTGMALALLIAAPAGAQDADRYTLEKSANGYVRMDRATGAMSICTEQGTQLVCKLAADDRDAFQTEIEALQTKIDDLDRRLAALETNGPTVGLPGLPTDEEFQKSLGLMETFVRRFLDMVKTLDPAEPEPDRT